MDDPNSPNIPTTGCLSGRAYIYPELETPRTIRLVKVLKDRSCSLNSAKLDDPNRPSYTALSYTWGDPLGVGRQMKRERPDEYINCDGSLISITPNLCDALVQLTSTHLNKFLWIDAICINQANHDERSKQVSLMGDIYAEATAVLVWLGEHDTHSKVAVPLIHNFQKKLKEMTGNGGRVKQYSLDDPGIFEELNLGTPYTTAQWESILTFYGRHWFHRTWVIQEIALGRNIAVSCGDWVAEWEVILEFAMWMRVQGWTAALRRRPELSGPTTLALGINFLLHMVQLSRMQQRGVDDPFVAYQIAMRIFGTSTAEGRLCAYLAWLVHTNRNFDISDPRDKIYAPLAMVSRLEQAHKMHMIQPNYKQSVEEVFTSFTTMVILNCCSLAVVLLVGDSVDRVRTSLPSWVPDFDDVASSRIFSHNYNSTRAWKSPPTGIVMTFPALELLQVEGVRFDSIIGCSENVGALLEGAEDASIFLVTDKLDPIDRQTGEHPWEIWMQTLAGDDFNTEGGSFGGDSEILKLENRWSYITRSFRQWVLSKTLTALSLSQGPEPWRHETVAKKWFAQYELVTKATSADRGDNIGNEYWRSLQKSFCSDGSKSDKSSDFRRKVMEEANLFLLLLRRHAVGSLGGPLVRTKDRNNLCLATRSARVGDEIWFLRGSKMPCVLRPRLSNGQYNFIGEAYVHNFMQGEYFLQEPSALNETGFTISQTIVIE